VSRIREALPTALNTEKIKFGSLSEIQFSLLCPICQKIHRWKQPDAWVELE
jgi:hypothetical protein